MWKIAAIGAKPATPRGPLPAAAVLFAAAVLVHNFDHLRRGGDSVKADVFWIGVFAIVVEVGVVVLALADHPRAPLAAVVAGLALAAGYVFVHFTPRRSWLSDSFVSGHTATMSIVAASLEAAAALVLAGAGVVALRRRRAVGGPGSTPPVSTRHGLRHPIVMVLILGNAVVLVGSFATR